MYHTIDFRGGLPVEDFARPVVERMRHAFADGLDGDYDAVVAGLTLPYSNRPTEGVVNKIKMLKRQTYGKASFPLLRKIIRLMD